jgi:hypothetical protein
MTGAGAMIAQSVADIPARIERLRRVAEKDRPALFT